MIEVAIRVSLMKQIFRVIKCIANPRSVEPSYRYFGVSCTEHLVSFRTCRGDMLGCWDCPSSNDVIAKSVGGPSEALMVDTVLFGELLKTLADDELLTFSHASPDKPCGTRLRCANHDALIHFNFDVRIEDFKSELDFGGPIAESSDSNAWDHFGVDLSSIAKRVDFCSGKEATGDEEFQCASVRFSVKDASFGGEEKEAGSVVQVQATDRSMFAHVGRTFLQRMPETELLIESSTISLVHQLKPSNFYYNRQSIAFQSDDGLVRIYCRNTLAIDKFPVGLVERIRSVKNYVLLQVERKSLENALIRQCLYADRTEGTTFGVMAVNVEKGVLAFTSDNRISHGEDFLPCTVLQGALPEGDLTVNPEGLLKILKRFKGGIVNLVLIPKEQSQERYYVGFILVQDQVATQSIQSQELPLLELCMAGGKRDEEGLFLTAGTIRTAI